MTFEYTGSPVVDRWVLKITHVIVDDPAFGTGPQGIDIDFSNAVPASASLPLEVTSPEYPLPFGLNIDFPNGAKLSTLFPNMSVDDLEVGLAESTLSGSKWQAGGTPQGHPLSGEFLKYPESGRRYLVVFKDWSLNKISDRPDTSVYDGTYSGMFNYEYREREWKNDPTDIFPTTVYKGDWISTSLGLTVTFTTKKARIGQPVEANIVRVACNDLDFDTGADGVIPRKFTVTLPPDPTMPNPRPNVDPSQFPVGFGITFPSEAMIKTGVKRESQLGSGFISVSPDGLILFGDTWVARTPRGVLSEKMLKDTPFVADTSPYERYEIRFKSWSLNKVPATLDAGKAKDTVSKDISGEVQIKKGGEAEWTKYDQTILNSGDEIKTGNSSKAVIETPDGDLITMGANSGLTIREWVAGENYSFELLSGELHAQVEKSNRAFEVRTPSVVTSVRGTEFTVDVENDGTTTVMVLEGAVSVQDRTSNEGITLVLGQSVTIPKTPGGLRPQDMLGRVTRVPTETLDRWWEKNPAATGGQSAVQNSALRGDGSVVIGKFEILSSGSRYTPAGFMFVFLVVVAIVFLIMGQVFAFRLRSVSKRG